MADVETAGATAPGEAATYDSVAHAVHWLVATLAVAVVFAGLDRRGDAAQYTAA